MIVSYMLDPLGAADVILLTGEQAWNLPIDYVAHGGKASDHHSDNPHYHWRKRPELLESMLREHLATPERWLDQFDQTAIPAPPADSVLPAVDELHMAAGHRTTSSVPPGA